MASFHNYQPPVLAELDLLYNRELSIMCQERGIQTSGPRDALINRLLNWRPRTVFSTPRALVANRVPPRTSYQLSTNPIDDSRAEREGKTPEEVAELKENFANLSEREQNAYRMVFQQENIPDGWPTDERIARGGDIWGLVMKARPLPTIEYLERLAAHYSHSDNEDIDNGAQKAEAIAKAIQCLDQMNDPHSPNVKPVGGRCIPHGGWLWKTIVLWSPWQLYDLDRFVPDDTLHMHWNAHSKSNTNRHGCVTTPPRRKSAARRDDLSDDE